MRLPRLCGICLVPFLTFTIPWRLIICLIILFTVKTLNWRQKFFGSSFQCLASKILSNDSDEKTSKTTCIPYYYFFSKPNLIQYGQFFIFFIKKTQSISSFLWPVSQQYFCAIKATRNTAPSNNTPPQNPKTPPKNYKMNFL